MLKCNIFRENQNLIMDYDVLISGAGPAGSKCAEILARNGFRVALIERDTNWRKPCGGGLMGWAYKYYPQLKSLNLPIKNSIIFYSADYHKLEYTYENYENYPIVIDRLEFDNLIRDIAVDAGAELFDKNLSIDFIIKNHKKIGIKTKTPSGIKEYFGKIIVIADGMGSKLAPKSGLRDRWKTEDLGLAKCAILEGKTSLENNFVYFYFRPYQGYNWIFPIDEKRFNIGVATFYNDNYNYNVNNLYTEFLKDPHVKKFLSSIDYKQIWGGAYPEPANGVLEKSLYGDNIMIVGDAAGFVSPVSGEGLHASVVSGKIAAETAIEALDKEDISKKILKKYKYHPNIKKAIRNFKLKLSFANFLYENKGQNLNTTFRLAESDTNFKEQVMDTFFLNKIPPDDFFSKIKSSNP
jgi:electron transfer flavoprotein-quinone oxidoreductase